ncbi:fungal specific transcription factor domain-containing protein [Aspergillus clavatus NRRL 1]|uniref:Fungal specific transcription factor domain protein n=1 Tax=Aspergillus clavatus (strain ATCC 1007 / CBS 513.65 / DSM 816 / NCTC 3887 / NRRL 1 / QM 1276 / 107) TaxID=344612 RepID=A1CPQ4_ASPCL|nr:fungal specific transcription factor domain protein [Aspergillus clavatus NRRL 1]EAW07625.1 fungal specific transcription factor domain protein [Aspergillus clavatus NRRL 1]
MQDRINQLESLVLELMHQTESRPRESSFEDLQHMTPDQRARSNRFDPRENLERATVVGYETQHDVSPSPSDYGSFRTPETGVNYVSSSHWAAVLDSITDLRNHIARDEEAHPRMLDPVQPPASFPKPQLLYSCAMHETSASILKSLPPRPTVDRLISRYFNVLDIAPGIVHSGKFLRELQQAFASTEGSSPTLGHSGKTSRVGDSQALAETYKEKAIQCLLLGHYTKGGPYVLETLILYFLIENFHLKDMEIGIWVLVGNIVQIAIHMGYHRDAKHFPSISPFAGEMRRRVWAMIVQLDFSVSTQLGLPRLVKESDTDTAEPRNLNDSDFDEDISTLPVSKPETEVTPTLYVLAKLRLLSVGAKVADVATEPHPHSYAEILKLDQRINEARDKIPSSLKWTGLASSLNVPSQIMIQRIWLEVIIQQLKIILHRKFLEPSRLHQQYDRSRSACLDAAMQILELQRLVDEETSADGLLYQSRWRVSSAFINDFLLATSVLCFYVQTHNKEQDTNLDNSRDSEVELDMDRIRSLLRTSQSIWCRQCASSREARKAVAALNYVLDDSRVRAELHTSEEASPSAVPATAVSYFPGYSDFTSNYDLSSMALGSTMEGMTWPIFTANLNNDVEQWLGGTGSQHMDMTL